MTQSLLKEVNVAVAAMALLSILGGCASQPTQRASPAPAAAPAAPAAASGGAVSELGIYKQGNIAPFALYLGSPNNWYDAIPQDKTANHGVIKAEPGQVNAPGDGKKVTWTGTGQMYAQSKTATDRLDYLDADAALVFDTVVHEAPQSMVIVRVDCKYPCIGLVDVTPALKSTPVGQKATIKIPLSCFAATGTDFGNVNTPFLVFTTARFSASFANIRWTPGAAKDADAMNCKKAK
ncbi:MAG TPA: putative glycoside hydrolase [Burkholderiales bacterium]|nr:putative glycoside hydrolase [Burkholderiales bacterium]